MLLTSITTQAMEIKLDRFLIYINALSSFLIQIQDTLSQPQKGLLCKYGSQFGSHWT